MRLSGSVLVSFREKAQIMKKAGMKRVLLLGSGYVSAPVIEYLTRDERTQVTVGEFVSVCCLTHSCSSEDDPFILSSSATLRRSFSFLASDRRLPAVSPLLVFRVGAAEAGGGAGSQISQHHPCHAGRQQPGRTPGLAGERSRLGRQVQQSFSCLRSGWLMRINSQIIPYHYENMSCVFKGLHSYFKIYQSFFSFGHPPKKRRGLKDTIAILGILNLL